MGSGDDEAARPFLLDTNVLVAYVRGGDLGRYIEQTFRLASSGYRPLVCVVSVGEALALARRFGWGQDKTTALQRLLRELVWIDISAPEVLEAYADVYMASTPKGRTVQQNDLWIAAAAKATGATLLTADRDFEHLAGEHIRVQWISPDARC